MKKLIPATAAAIALVGGIAAGTALAFPPAPPAGPAGYEHAAFGREGGHDRGPMGGPGMHGGSRSEMRDHQGPYRGPHGGPQGGFNLEQRAEHMKERLKITEAQKPQWDALVGVMQKQQRAFALSQAEVWQKRANGETPQALTAPERMAERNKAAETRLNSQREFAAAFANLYNAMSPDQKKIADDLLSGRRHRG